MQKKLIRKAFSSGFMSVDFLQIAKDNFKKFVRGKGSIISVAKSLVNYSFPSIRNLDLFPKEKNYVYFQDFIPNNVFDIRVFVINGKAFAIKRMVRENDFRASGSGILRYEKENFSEDVIKMSFDIIEKLKAKCLTFDFIFDSQGRPLVVETSYGALPKAYLSCAGYWTRDMVWHEGDNFDFMGWMVETVLK